MQDTNKVESYWDKKYPKEHDLEWKEMVGQGKYEILEGEPEFDLGVVEYNIRNVNPDRTIDHEFF